MKIQHQVLGVTLVLSAIGMSGCPESTPPPDVTFDAAADVPIVDIATDRPDVPLVSCTAPDGLTFRTDDVLPPDCERYVGIISFSDSRIRNPSALASIREIDGVLDFLRNLSMDSLMGLERLESVEELGIRSHPLLVGVSELASLRRVENLFIVQGNPAITSLAGLEQLESVGDLTVYSNDALTDLDGLSGLRRVRGNIRIGGASLVLSEVETFLEGLQVDGEVDLSYFD